VGAVLAREHHRTEQQVQELFLKDPWRDIYRGKG
jgi:hypothetical protein